MNESNVKSCILCGTPPGFRGVVRLQGERRTRSGAANAGTGQGGTEDPSPLFRLHHIESKEDLQDEDAQENIGE